MPGPQPPAQVAILSQTVMLTDAQIKAANNPVIIVPATEVLNYSGLPTQVPLPIAFSITVNLSDGAYTNVAGDAKYVLAIGSDWSSDAMKAAMSGMAQLAGTSLSQVGIANSYNNDIVADVISPLHISAGGLQDNALAIVISNGNGALTGGGSANSMRVTVLYTIIDIS